MKRNIIVKVFSDDSLLHSIPTKPEEFLDFWGKKFDLIPEEYKSTGAIYWTASVSYDCPILEVDIWYVRPETDEEEAARIKKEDDHRKLIENQELCQLEKLRNKYGI